MTSLRNNSVRHVVASTPDWHLSGVNVFTTRLFRELRARGWETTIVITNPTAAPAELAPVPDDLNIVRLPPTPNRAIRHRQALLRDALTERAPCVYLPNYDFDTAGVLPTLPRSVVVAGVVHSDEEVYYDFIRDLGAWMDGVVAVSTSIETEIAARLPGVKDRLTRIAYGVPVRDRPPAKPQTPPLRVVFAGRLSKRQKRTNDLADVIAAVHKSGASVMFDIAGDGPDRGEFEKRAAASIAAGTTRMHGAISPEATARLFDQSHVLILTSEFEGLPVVMLEAMEAGCVPLVTRIRSGVGDLVEDGRNGILFPIGDVASAADALRQLATGALPLETMAAAARARLESSEFTIARATDRYSALFESMLTSREDGTFRHKPGRAFMPRHHRWGTRIAVRLAQITGRKHNP
ncbi:MAG TPA: glycosyltransferase family 4 protein [Opitutaceae bacterium]|nr:glycosyltransferase family 4 protein [Opitutaceae bacterium]